MLIFLQLTFDTISQVIIVILFFIEILAKVFPFKFGFGKFIYTSTSYMPHKSHQSLQLLQNQYIKLGFEKLL